MGLLDRLSRWLGGNRVPAQVLVLGLDNAGKTSLLAALRAPDGRPDGPGRPDGRPDADVGLDAGGVQIVAPTVAPQQDHFQSGGVQFSAWDVSGAARHRALWERHYRNAHAIVFVVDAADHLRLVVAREELELVLAHPAIAGRRIPLLLLAHKSDEPTALPPQQVAAALGMERVADKPWHVAASSARRPEQLRDALAWLARQLRDQLARR